MTTRSGVRAAVRATAVTAIIALIVACSLGRDRVAPVLSPRKALKTFKLAPGYGIELVAAEPLVKDPIAIDFDADGRMYVVEMSGYMPVLSGEGEDRPTGAVVILEDLNDDGRMDRRTVFLDSLVLPRTVAVLERGVLVGAPPYLWLVRDTTGDLRADVREVVRDDYGSSAGNPEHNANAALWGMDNWLHTANYTSELRLRADGSFESRVIPSLGQWGVSSDVYGRLYRNSNESPLRTDLIPAHYSTRDGGTAPARGVYSALTPNVAVWPARKTPAVNRGYRKMTMRDDSTLAHYTAAGSPTAYIGDRFPAEMHRSVFVAEPAGNLVGQFNVEDRADGARIARRADERTDFLTSTDERFRPVSLANAPDGSLYVVDMYRGIIQHRTFITDYLEEKIRERGLEQPIGYGRIYRVVHLATGRGPSPRLAEKPTVELVELLAHPNGWWRFTAQRMIVERGDHAVAPALRALLESSDDRVRLHALWTLDGLGEADSATVLRGFADPSQHVRAAALRIAEVPLAEGSRVVLNAALAMLDDPDVPVRRQLAASLGALPMRERYTAFQALLDHGVSDAVAADLIARAAGPRARDLLGHVLARERSDSGRVVVEALAAVAGRTRDDASIRQLVDWATVRERPPALRIALLAGLARGAGSAARPASVTARPTALLAMAAGSDSALADAASRVAQVLRWPGKPQPVVDPVRALTREETERIEAGRAVFATTCASCHQPDARGAPGGAATLVGARYVTGTPLRLIRILLQGKEGTQLMPPVGATMTDDALAAVLSYIRHEWGNRAVPISAVEVREIRGATTGRRRPWTDDELARINR